MDKHKKHLQRGTAYDQTSTQAGGHGIPRLFQAADFYRIEPYYPELFGNIYKNMGFDPGHSIFRTGPDPGPFQISRLFPEELAGELN